MVGLMVVVVAGLTGYAWSGGFAQSARLYLLVGALPGALLLPALTVRRGAALKMGRAAGLWLLVVGGLWMATDTGEPAGVRAGGAVGVVFDRLVQSSRARFSGDLTAQDAVDEFEARRGFVVPWLTTLLPALIAAVGLLGMWINVVYVRWFSGGTEKREEDLCLFKLPFGLIWVVLSCMAVLLVQLAVPGLAWGGWGVAPILAANALFILAVLYWLQGVAVVNWWFLRLPLTPVPRALGIGVQAALMAIPVVSVAYLVTGLSDVWLDLRRRQGDDEVTSRNGARR